MPVVGKAFLVPPSLEPPLSFFKKGLLILSSVQDYQNKKVSKARPAIKPWIVFDFCRNKKGALIISLILTVSRSLFRSKTTGKKINVSVRYYNAGFIFLDRVTKKKSTSLVDFLFRQFYEHKVHSSNAVKI